MRVVDRKLPGMIEVSLVPAGWGGERAGDSGEPDADAAGTVRWTPFGSSDRATRVGAREDGADRCLTGCCRWCHTC